VLQAQAQSDSDYVIAQGDYTGEQQQAIRDVMLKAYRWQYIVSGVQEGSFVKVLASMIPAEQLDRVTSALAPLM